MNKKVVLITAATALFIGVGGYAYIDHIEGSKQVTATVTQGSKQNVAPVTKNQVVPNEIKEETISADHAIFENYQDALSLSQVVAEVVATDNSENVITDENGFTTGHTRTEVQVNKVFENKSGNEIGESINVLEPTYIAEGEEGPTRFNYEEYTKMEPGLKYVVFLVWNEKKQGYWISSLEQGKFSLDNSDKAEMSLLAENSQYEVLKNDVIQTLYGESVNTTDQ
ncbi:hypothetical protein BK126_28305 [Paenibacillus sp. FSL H7-0326]|uniref:hypothetical protein n=1 Tax=Paenibacillus sp. FSL H7-0326 TaxID=1921144 RepID=UPI00096EFCB2|nr:hypothetical protein [Paenibacillus sp. FSL H7-0326]OMC62770.1 hypothetical protein BK126_28305 [Paenibacillus sp. FSL H7-0326]